MEYEVLGLKLKLKDNEAEGGVSPKEVVEFVQSKAMKIKEQNPRLDNGQVGILLALELAKENITLDNEFSKSVEKFDLLAKEAFELIDEATC